MWHVRDRGGALTWHTEAQLCALPVRCAIQSARIWQQRKNKVEHLSASSLGALGGVAMGLSKFDDAKELKKIAIPSQPSRNPGTLCMALHGTAALCGNTIHAIDRNRGQFTAWITTHGPPSAAAAGGICSDANNKHFWHAKVGMNRLTSSGWCDGT